MEFIRTLREKSQTRKEESIQKEAERRIRLSDFDNTLYISYDGTPLMPVEENCATKQIIEKLTMVRQNYIKSHLREDTLRTAMF